MVGEEMAFVCSASSVLGVMTFDVENPVEVEATNEMVTIKR